MKPWRSGYPVTPISFIAGAWLAIASSSDTESGNAPAASCESPATTKTLPPMASSLARISLRCGSSRTSRAAKWGTTA